MRLLLLPQVSLLLLAYFQGSTGQSRQKRQFGMVNPNDDVPFNFGNSFDGGQATFERQKGTVVFYLESQNSLLFCLNTATLMREFELKLAELRANNRQELANAVMELKHQLTGLGRTLLLGRNPEKEKEVITIATTTTENGDDQLHRTMLSKLEALHRNFTKLMNNYQSAAGHVAPLQFSNDKQKHQQQRDKQSQSKEAKKKKKQQKQQSKWDNDLELDESNFDDLDDDHYGLGNEAKSVKKSKPKKKVSKVLESPAVEQPPSLFDSYQRQPLSVVGRSMDEDKENRGGGGELQDQLSTGNNKYIYYLVAAGLAIFAYCCFAANSADNVNPMQKNQEMLEKRREKAKRRRRRRRMSHRRHKKSEDDADEKEERPSSKNKRSKGRRQSQSQSRHSRESKSLSGGRTRHRGFSSSGTAGSLKQQPQQNHPVTNNIATGFTLHQMNNNTAAAGQLTGDEEGQVIVIEADQVRQFWGGGIGNHSDMATRLEEMMDQSRFISQLIHHEHSSSSRQSPLITAKNKWDRNSSSSS
ncbi:hypothetical protein TYRP_004180, partial [Tyrophagus putrescentiae]